MRLRGHYFAIASLSLIEVFRELVNNATDLTGGGMGLNIPLTSAAGVLSDATFFFYAMWALLLGTAEVRVAPRGDRASIVTWVEDVYLAGPLPPALTRRVLAPVLAGMVRLALWRAAREVASGHEEHPNEG